MRRLSVERLESRRLLALLVTNTNDRIDLLENVVETGHHWIGFRLKGSPKNPSAVGARIVLRRGKAIDTTPPDYRELDDLFETAS